MHTYNIAATRRKTLRLADDTGLRVATVSSQPVEFAHQLSVGGRIIHKRTRRCVAFCNAVAGLAGLGPLEVR